MRTSPEGAVIAAGGAPLGGREALGVAAAGAGAGDDEGPGHVRGAHVCRNVERREAGARAEVEVGAVPGQLGYKAGQRAQGGVVQEGETLLVQRIHFAAQLLVLRRQRRQLADQAPRELLTHRVDLRVLQARKRRVV